MMARAIYAGSANAARTPRSIEHEAFATVARRLNAALANGADGFPALAEALHDNRRLWTVVAADVAEPTNGLPQSLRGRLFYLAEFTRHHTAKVLAGQADARALVEINMAVMRGLRGQEDVG